MHLQDKPLTDCKNDLYYKVKLLIPINFDEKYHQVHDL